MSLEFNDSIYQYDALISVNGVFLTIALDPANIYAVDDISVFLDNGVTGKILIYAETSLGVKTLISCNLYPSGAQNGSRLSGISGVSFLRFEMLFLGAPATLKLATRVRERVAT